MPVETKTASTCGNHMVAYGTTRDAENNIQLCAKDVSGEINPNPKNRDLLQNALINTCRTPGFFVFFSRHKNEFPKFREKQMI